MQTNAHMVDQEWVDWHVGLVAVSFITFRLRWIQVLSVVSGSVGTSFFPLGGGNASVLRWQRAGFSKVCGVQ